MLTFSPHIPNLKVNVNFNARKQSCAAKAFTWACCAFGNILLFHLPVPVIAESKKYAKVPNTNQIHIQKKSE